jgi:hypothetical protein
MKGGVYFLLAVASGEIQVSISSEKLWFDVAGGQKGQIPIFPGCCFGF